MFHADLQTYRPLWPCLVDHFQQVPFFSKDVQAVGIILIGQFGKDLKFARDIAGAKLFDLCSYSLTEIFTLISYFPGVYATPLYI